MNNILELPQLTAKFSYDLPKNEVVLVSGGNPPDKNWLLEVSNNRTIYCADHGIDSCKQAGIIPFQLIGDGDSATKEAWSWAIEQNVKVTKVPAKKDVTDTQLALQIIDDKYSSSTIIFTGAWGGRFDHAFSSIFSFKGMLKDNFRGCIADEREIMFFLQDEENITLNLKQQPKAISLLPLTGICSGVSINGVYWPLEQVMLNNNLPYAVSNEVENLENTIWISQTQGFLGVYLYFE